MFGVFSLGELRSGVDSCVHVASSATSRGANAGQRIISRGEGKSRNGNPPYYPVGD